MKRALSSSAFLARIYGGFGLQNTQVQTNTWACSPEPFASHNALCIVHCFCLSAMIDQFRCCSQWDDHSFMHNASKAEKCASLYFTQDAARVGLAEFADGYKRHSVSALSNIAQALLQMGQYELALGYAVAATRLDAFGTAPNKALYRAALCCSLLRQPLAALHFVCQVCASCWRSFGSTVSFLAPKC